ncbi:uncharacterized protein GGS22DRAFT_192274 [Annulohypoxylon maeteangense]|uniref:uncharacterized protein n=1 Tax=Annulohypoxylon maeteangense TaxID=1927788 RepID=UPI0020078D7B|nr:uncharacterized protein GGS22DRAFT_192274 [Annulohypoxylon maeteangense]KAI0881638.1 hypothetical protein GGS22DRAFT_192274 [Annulohypoxylon maeteangense]
MAKSLSQVLMRDIMASKPVKFVIGPSRKEFFAPANAFTEISPALRILITGSKSDSIVDAVVLNDINEEDFLNLCEYAYSSDYKEPEANDPPPKVPFRPKGDAAKAYGNDLNQQSLFLFNDCRERRKVIQEWHNKYGKPPRKNIREANYSYGFQRYKDWTETLLRHVKMYIIANKYDVGDLRSLARFYLLWRLYGFVDTWDSIPALGKLVRYVYENTQEHDELRGLISSYVALKSESLFLHPHMQSVRDDYPKFCSDVLKSTTERLVRELQVVNEGLTQLKRKNEELEEKNGSKRSKIVREEIGLVEDDSESSTQKK